MAHSPPGHHSVIGRPSSEGLSFAEYVVYRGEQVSNYFLLVSVTLLRNYSPRYSTVNSRYSGHPRDVDYQLLRDSVIAGVIVSQTSIAFAGWRAGFCP